MREENEPVVVEVASLQEFFREALQEAVGHQRFELDDHTEHYVVNMLTLFSRSEALFDRTPEGSRLRPLALMLAEAVQAGPGAARVHALQRLGDVSLFAAGFLSGSFSRRLVDVDYHIAMGGRAYDSLASMLQGTVRGKALSAVFHELAAKFQRLVDALNEVAESACEHSDSDLLRLYEVYLKTGSPRARGLLLKLGVQPVKAALREH
jgi:hypothetical protein